MMDTDTYRCFGFEVTLDNTKNVPNTTLLFLRLILWVYGYKIVGGADVRVN